MCADKERKRETDEDPEKKQKRRQQTKAETRTMEGHEHVEISFKIEKAKLHPKSVKITLPASLSTRKIDSTREDVKKEVVACEREHCQSGDITQPDMSSQAYIELSASLRKVTDYVKSIDTDSETELQKKTELLRKINSLKHEILAFSGMSEETKQRCRHEIQSSSTATKQPLQRHPGDTN